MDSRKQAPDSLKVVAALFVLTGLVACVEVIFSLVRGHLSLNFAVLGIFIGRGLLQLRPRWLVCALAVTWLYLLLSPLLLAAVLADRCPTYLSLFGARLCDASPPVAVLGAVSCFAFGLWQYRVLTKAVKFFHQPGR